MNRIEREKAFHDQRFSGGDDERKAVDKYYSINNNIVERFHQIIKGYCLNRNMLEYGCGTGYASQTWVDYGANLTGIDISPEGIKKAKKNVPKGTFIEMNAEKMDFQDSMFDIVIGSGILHHLNLKQSLSELSRVLSDDGNAVFIEPLGHNPIINLYRWLTPKMRSEDEHPLLNKDIILLSDYFSNVKVEYFTLTSLLAVPFRNKAFFNKTLNLLRFIDNLIFKVPYFRRFAWIVILHMDSPKK